MMKKLICSILLGILVMLGICGCGNQTVQYVDSEVGSEKHSSEEVEESKEDATEMSGEPRLIYVYVCGAVSVPGVYALQEGSRVCDLFLEAGGFTENAAQDYWNQARTLVDGEMIYVPTIEEAQERSEAERLAAGSGSGATDANDEVSKKVNINKASKEELMTLPGIGETRAVAILQYRQEHGGFTSIEELMQISGIKDGLFSKIEDYIVVD